jgi:RNA polymerase sigma-70 factor (family 1)
MEGNQGNIIDLSTLEELFREHYHALCQAAYYVSGSTEVARDVVQDFFFHCWNKRKDMRIVGDFKSYAIRSVKNASLNYLRDNKKIKVTDESAFSNIGSEELKSSFDNADEAEKNRALWKAVEKLPEQRKAIFLSSNRDGFSYAQTAEKMGISVNTVKTQIRLAYKFLREECAWLLHTLLIVLLLKK